MFRNYHIHKLDGYNGGRPSWLKFCWARSKEEAERLLAELRKAYPRQQFRIRIAPKRR